MKNVIFIRGLSGVGKTTVARKMQSGFPAGATIEVDAILAMLDRTSEKDPSQYDCAFGAASLIALHFIECGYGPIFILGYVSDSFLEDWKTAGVQGLRVYTLVASEDVLSRRNLGRKRERLIQGERGIMELAITDAISACEEVVIDTSDLSVGVLSKILLDDLGRE